MLAGANVVQHKLTIPEGLTSEQIVQRLHDDDVLVGDIKEIPREGSLMPDTYNFESGDTRQAQLARMAKEQAKVVDEIWRNRSPDLPIKSPGEMVTLASIVEKGDRQARRASARRRRVHQSAAKAHAARVRPDDRLRPRVRQRHARPLDHAGRSSTRPTPYNTYLIDGLPPGPISNPGKAALEAVAKPVRSKDLYFVADGTGGHVFADTLEQHLKNVARWRQIEKDAKDRLAPDVDPSRRRSTARSNPSIPRRSARSRRPRSRSRRRPRFSPASPRSAQAGTRSNSALASLSPAASGGKSIEDLGAVVAGVNDFPPRARRSLTRARRRRRG